MTLTPTAIDAAIALASPIEGFESPPDTFERFAEFCGRSEAPARLAASDLSRLPAHVQDFLWVDLAERIDRQRASDLEAGRDDLDLGTEPRRARRSRLARSRGGSLAA